MRILITGGSGFLGQALTRVLLARGDEVIILSRAPERHRSSRHGSIWVTDLSQIHGSVDAVINLTGANLFSLPWTRKRQQYLHDSRVATSWKLVSWLCSQAHPPKCLLSGSAIGIYGDQGEQALTEESAAGSDWAAALVADWEHATQHAAATGIRTVLLRTGLVLGNGGLLKPLLPVFKLGLGGSLGNGQFWYSWIHLEDWVRATLFLLDSEEAFGPWNLTAPHPVRYAEFASTLGRSLHRPVWLTPPRWALRLLLGKRANLMLASTKALPQRLQEAGFQWQYPGLNDTAMASILASTTPATGKLNR
jgi:uncharacterized protein (TIGR01777 family)